MQLTEFALTAPMEPSHDFQLTTLLVVDEFGAGCPVAFCLSNKIDTVAMSRFFLSVKEKVGLISTKVLMYDDTLMPGLV